MARIVIDPGHGGHDPGALGSKSKEKDNVLKVAKLLRDILIKAGHTVKLTRNKDVFVSLANRAKIANDFKADLFLSLHNNSAKDAKATGFETFIWNGSVSSDTVKAQKHIHDAIAYGVGVRNRGKKKANFLVLRQTKMSALLIEYAFINNPNDESILINQVDKLANLTYDGIHTLFFGTPSKKPSVPKKKNPKPSIPNSKKGVDTLAKEVIAGKWKDGEARKKALGSRYSAVQKRVNELLKGKSKPKNTKTLNQLVDEVNRGLHGNGAKRKRSLGSRYAEVQREINRRYR